MAQQHEAATTAAQRRPFADRTNQDTTATAVNTQPFLLNACKSTSMAPFTTGGGSSRNGRCGHDAAPTTAALHLAAAAASAGSSAKHTSKENTPSSISTTGTNKAAATEEDDAAAQSRSKQRDDLLARAARARARADAAVARLKYKQGSVATDTSHHHQKGSTRTSTATPKQPPTAHTNNNHTNPQTRPQLGSTCITATTAIDDENNYHINNRHQTHSMTKHTTRKKIYALTPHKLQSLRHEHQLQQRQQDATAREATPVEAPHVQRSRACPETLPNDFALDVNTNKTYPPPACTGPTGSATTPSSSKKAASATTAPRRARSTKKAHVFKILVVGNSKCGKTSIIERYCNDNFDTGYNITIGADYTKKVIPYDESHTVRLQLWDIAGQDRFANLTRPYYRNARAAVIVCDVTRPATLRAVREWKKDLDDKLNGNEDQPPIPTILVANKCDLLTGVPQAIETGAEIEHLCDDLNLIKWFIASAKSDANINESMSYLVDALMQDVLNKERERSSDRKTTKKKRKGGRDFRLGNGVHGLQLDKDTDDSIIRLGADTFAQEKREANGCC